MLIRALIVLLAVLNIGVAAWWLASKPLAPYQPAPLPANTPTLQLADESFVPAAPVSSSAAPVAPVAAPVAQAVEPVAASVPEPAKSEAPKADIPKPEAPKPAEILQCLRFGPFANKGDADALLSRIGALAAKAKAFGTPAKPAKAYSVFVPPQANALAAQALAEKIANAGFNDYFVQREGENANGIALGTYRNRDGAESRLAALQKAGFPAQLRAVGEDAQAQWWADAAFADANLAAARQRGNAPAKALDCAGLK